MKYNGAKEWDTLPTFRPRVQFPSPAPLFVQLIYVGHTKSYSSTHKKEKNVVLYINMTDLHKKDCIPCRGGVPAFDISEIHKYLKKVDGWDVKKNGSDSYFIEKNFNFGITPSKNYIGMMTF